jgi:hypothetical protein
MKGKDQIKRVDNVWEERRGERMDERIVSSCKASAMAKRVNVV